MCFSGEMSAAFSAAGLLACVFVWFKTKNATMTSAIFFFCLMEILQVTQQWIIAPSIDDIQCKNRTNQILTILGYVHIQFQPYFTNKYFSAFRPYLGKSKPGEDVAWKLVDRLCLFSCFLQMLRLFLSPGFNKEDLTQDQVTWLSLSQDWLEGPQMCTYKGAYHLAWSIPLSQPTYFIPGMGLHCFLMFVPVLCIGGFGELDSFLWLFVGGPVLSHFITDNRHENASIWCFFSIIQVIVGVVSVFLQGKLGNADNTAISKGAGAISPKAKVA